MLYGNAPFEALKGKTLAAIEGAEKDSEEIRFRTIEGETWLQSHSQDCCECVSVEEVVGDVADLVGTPILEAEKVTHEGETPEGLTLPSHDDSYTWTFYKLATIRGSVTIRWFGSSNGYYSEEVSFAREDVEAEAEEA